ncbi:MAG: ATP-dependent DNA helicase RecQ [Sulfurimonas sp.]|jgi:ATP-dependent DNA helicase RecQ
MTSFTLLQQKILDYKITEIIDDMHPVYKRFFQSYNRNFSDRSLLDIAILLRQILLLESTYRGNNNYATLEVPVDKKWPKEKEWKMVGIQSTKDGAVWNISAEFWSPDWLNGSDKQAVDYWVSSELNKRDEINFPSDATDIFLNHCGDKYNKYTSIDQQKAIRSTLSLGRGKTLTISLPTGEGKSLVFKSINSVGFFDTKNKGLTLVIVPTVTLALDQEKDIQEEQNSSEPYAYIGGRELENNIIKEKIKNSEQDICFVSPEAAYGPLRQSLIIAAKNGKIKAIVIDEAHIIEEWGTGFRHDYQLFSGLWRQLLEVSPSTNQFRTVLLSATFTQESIKLVESLFSKDSQSLEIYSASKLRPEIDYWVAETTDNEILRETRVIEALQHLPRPIILYTTEVKDAKKYFKLLQDIGIRNINIIHGQSSTRNRNNVIEKWKSGNLDVVVATSAFGLGIDYQHTRSIVHACVPETLNRFYQEVGRGGRDGRSSISLLIPTNKDLATARKMNQKKFLENDNAYNRWQTMFNSKQIVKNKHDEYIIDLGEPPSVNRDYDSKGHNRDWNIHVILLMARAKLLQLAGIPTIEFDDISFEDYNRYIIVRILNENHYNKNVWTQNIEPIRLNNRSANKQSIDLLYKFMKQDSCPADIISKLYQFSYFSKTYDVSLLCSNCNICRSGQKEHSHAPLRRSFPIQLNSPENISNLFLSESILVEYQEDDFEDRKYKRNIHKIFQNFVMNGIQNFIFVGNIENKFLTDKTLKKINNIPIFIERAVDLRKVILSKKNLPNKSTVIIIGNDVKLDEIIVDILKAEETIVFLPNNSIDPITPTRLLSEVYSNKILNIKELIDKVGL